jgi:hypothetical protein
VLGYRGRGRGGWGRRASGRRDVGGPGAAPSAAGGGWRRSAAVSEGTMRRVEIFSNEGSV